MGSKTKTTELDYNHLKKSIKSVKEIPITDYLGELGHKPKYFNRKNRKAWYSSPLQGKIQGSPSFTVDVESNTWGDFSNGSTNGMIGGDILDLVQKIHNCTLIEAISKLQGKKYTPILLPQIEDHSKTNEASVKKIQPLQNKALTAYLKSRCIDVSTAKLYLQEIYYYQGEKHFFGLAFKNRSDGYETRNKYSNSKRCIGQKDISIIGQNSAQVSVFEGFMDFLSVLSYRGIKRMKSDVIVLNSTALLSRALPIIQTYQKCFAFLDNDDAGLKATNQIQEVIPTKPMNYLYTNYKDFNDFLTSKNNL